MASAADTPVSIEPSVEATPMNVREMRSLTPCHNPARPTFRTVRIESIRGLSEATIVIPVVVAVSSSLVWRSPAPR